MDCNEAVELVTEFLDDALSPHAELKFLNHVRGCMGCTQHLEQVQRTVAELRGLPAEQQLSAETRAQLVAAFSRSVQT